MYMGKTQETETLDDFMAKFTHIAHRYSKSIYTSLFLITCLIAYSTYVYTQVLGINTHNTTLIHNYMRYGNIKELEGADYRYKSLCYSTELIELIYAIHNNPAEIKKMHAKYSLLYYLLTDKNTLHKAYPTLSIEDKKYLTEHLYIKLGFGFPAYLKDHANIRVTLAEIGNEHIIENFGE